MVNQDKKKIPTPLLFIDGECFLCDAFLQFVLKKDTQHKFYYTHLQSNLANNILSDYTLSGVDLKTVILLKNNKIYTKSDVAIQVFKQLGGFWKILAQIMQIFPKSIRDLVYRLIAKYRYKIWGKSDACILPTKDIKDRFIF